MQSVMKLRQLTHSHSVQQQHKGISFTGVPIPPPEPTADQILLGQILLNQNALIRHLSCLSRQVNMLGGEFDLIARDLATSSQAVVNTGQQVLEVNNRTLQIQNTQDEMSQGLNRLHNKLDQVLSGLQFDRHA